MFTSRLSVAVAALLLQLAAGSAQAQTAMRAWVSGHGTDSAGCGAPTAPCRSLQYTHDNIVAAGGEIDVLDPAGYGSLVITKGISIVNDGVGTAGVQVSSGSAIVINAPSGAGVILRGLDIEGLGTGFDGIVFNSGSSLSIEHVSIHNFTGTGVQFQPTNLADLYVLDSTIAKLGEAGVNVTPQLASISGSVQVTIARLVARNDTQAGVFIDGRFSPAAVNLDAVVSDSVLSGNTGAGLVGITAAANASTFVIVRDCVITHNGTGLSTQQAATVYVGRSTIAGNNAAFAKIGVSGLGSYSDNNVEDNVSVGASPTIVGFH